MNTFRLQLRFLVPLLLTLGVAAYLALPLVDRLTLRWFSRDLVTRGELLTNALSDSISDAVKDPEGVRLKALFDVRLKARDNVYLTHAHGLDPASPAALFRDWILSRPERRPARR